MAAKKNLVADQQAEINNLRIIINSLKDELEEERGISGELAKLASETPLFYNPFHVWEAKRIRDQILRDRFGIISGANYTAAPKA